MCIPNFIYKHGGYTNRATVSYVLADNKKYFPKGMKKAIKKCRDFTDTRFIFFTFMLIASEKETLSHANIIVIDLHKKTVERFEPYGSTVPGDRGNKIKKILDDLFKKFVLKYIGLPKFKYIPPSYVSSRIGIQSKADAYYGMCITISMMYLQMRIMNPDTKQPDIIKYFMKMTQKELINKILRYARYVERALKDKADFVNFLENELYNKAMFQEN